MESVAAQRLTTIGQNPRIISTRPDLNQDLKVVQEMLRSEREEEENMLEESDLSEQESTPSMKEKTGRKKKVKSKSKSKESKQQHPDQKSESDEEQSFSEAHVSRAKKHRAKGEKKKGSLKEKESDRRKDESLDQTEIDQQGKEHGPGERSRKQSRVSKSSSTSISNATPENGRKKRKESVAQKSTGEESVSEISTSKHRRHKEAKKKSKKQDGRSKSNPNSKENLGPGKEETDLEESILSVSDAKDYESDREEVSHKRSKKEAGIKRYATQLQRVGALAKSFSKSLKSLATKGNLPMSKSQTSIKDPENQGRGKWSRKYLEVHSLKTPASRTLSAEGQFTEEETQFIGDVAVQPKLCKSLENHSRRRRSYQQSYTSAIVEYSQLNLDMSQDPNPIGIENNQIGIENTEKSSEIFQELNSEPQINQNISRSHNDVDAECLRSPIPDIRVDDVTTMQTCNY